MPKCRVEILPVAWQDLNAIADYHLQMVGTASAEKLQTAYWTRWKSWRNFP